MNLIKYYLFLFITLFCSCTNDKDDLKPMVEPICDLSNVVQKGNRMVGIDLLDLTESNTFDNNLSLASELGIQFMALHIPWTSIETSPNNFVDPNSTLELLSQVASANNLKLSLTIRPIDLTGKTVPEDLENVRFNSEDMINRFNAVVDFIFSKVNPNILLNLQIGNEIDGYDLSSEPATFWSDYSAFLNKIATHIHSVNPNLKVGFTGTFNGLMKQQDIFKALLQSVDILGVTYYPIDSEFNVNEPTTVFDDFKDLIEAFDSKPIYLQEVGYQTSSASNSDQSRQAAFYCNVFKAWDAHPEKIKSMEIVRLNDLSLQLAQESAAPYGI